MLQVFAAFAAALMAAVPSLDLVASQFGLEGVRLGMVPSQVKAVSKTLAQVPYPVKGRFKLAGASAFDGCEFRAEVRGGQGGVSDIDLAFTHGAASVCAGTLVPRLTRLYGAPDYRLEGPGTLHPQAAKGTHYWWRNGSVGVFVAVTQDPRVNPLVMSVVDVDRSDTMVHQAAPRDCGLSGAARSPLCAR